jgi:exopolysaccharide production protein ExoF
MSSLSYLCARTLSTLVAVRCVLLASLFVMAGVGFAQADADSYKLAPGDILSFDILDDSDLPVTLTISSDGAAQFPLLGTVRVAGLTVPQARLMVVQTYAAKQILKNPKIALNISTFRPIFVLGEVKSPGSFPFQQDLTVEQAVGLAGGTQSGLTNPSDKIVTQARLRGQVDGFNIEIVHEAVYAARLAAQLKKRAKIDIGDIPASAKEYTKNVPLESILEMEQKILDTDLQTSRAQEDILNNGIAEGENGIKILSDLEAEQREVVAMNVADLERISSLRKRELNTIAELVRAKSATSNEKARLLEIYAEASRSRRELSDLKLQLAKLQADREKDILLKIQENELAIKKAIVERNAAEQQYFLLSSTAFESSGQSKVMFNFQIRRSIDGNQQLFLAKPLTAMLPGDVVIVSIVGM